MAYCIKCGTKNEDDSEFCKKCGASLTGIQKGHEKDDDCVCSGSKQNPLVPVFFSIVCERPPPPCNTKTREAGVLLLYAGGIWIL